MRDSKYIIAVIELQEGPGPAKQSRTYKHCGQPRLFENCHQGDKRGRSGAEASISVLPPAQTWPLQRDL